MSGYHETGVDEYRPLPPELPLWMREPLRNKRGEPQPCMHDGCGRYAVRIVSHESPRHKQFRGQTHECCSVHSRPTRSR